jgi:hypothetical protein
VRIEKTKKFVYPLSGEHADVHCVSFPTFHQMDALLVDAQDNAVIAEIVGI